MRSMRPSSSATTRACAESLSRSAAPDRRAVSSRPQVTRRARSGSARRCRCRAPSVCARISRSSGPTSRNTAPPRRRSSRSSASVTPLSRAAVSGRGVSRRHRERVGRWPLGRDVARRIKADIRDATRAHGIGRRRAQQVPRQDRLRLEEARWPDRHRARARRTVSAEPAGRCALGCRPGDGGSAPRSAGSNAWSMSGPLKRRCFAKPSGITSNGFAALPTGSTIVRSSRIARRSRAGPRTRSQRT